MRECVKNDKVEHMNKKGTVYVGLSGGVDSSVAAALLKKEGYDVVGVFIKVWQPDEMIRDGRSELCTWKEDRLDAMRVAAHLDIPFKTMDFEKEYKKDVVDYMLDAYRRGLTPNPDVMCNKSIKFGAFFKAARAEGADFVATGHYAQVEKVGDTYNMLRGVDSNKDQTYFLWTLGQEQLSHTLFPVGAYPKSEVRKLAEEFGLITATKKDSQGLCFMGKLNMREFLQNFIKEKTGNVINESGDVIGTHEGAMFYTAGQRHGFTITKKTPNDEPYYVIDKNIDNNTVTVSHTPLKDTSDEEKEVSILLPTFTSGEMPFIETQLTAQVRYRQEPQDCTLLSVTKEKATVLFSKPQILPPGQSVVLYNKDICLGGGVIE